MDDLYQNRFISEHFRIFRELVSKNLELKPSVEFVKYFELPDEFVRRKVHVSDILPEAYGYEDTILHLISEEENEFRIPDISRMVGRGEIFFNILFVYVPNYNSLYLFVEDTTARMISRRELQQSRNNIILLNNEISGRNLALEKSNSELRILQNNMNELNRRLELKVSERTIELEINLKKTKRVFEQTVKSLSIALEKRDPYTAGHQERVSDLSAAIAGKLNFNSDAVEGIKIASRLHDIGKIYVPSEFLTRPGRLTEEEFSVIKMHPIIGFEILRDIEFPWPVAAIVLQHHERINGSGYPYGLSGDEIMIEAQILAVSDIVETIATDRPYRKAPGLDYAMKLLEKEKGVSLDTDVVEACFEVFSSEKFSFKNFEFNTGGVFETY